MAELSSTHPLTGKRVRALATLARQLGTEPPFDFARIAAAGRRLDHARLKRQFTREILINLAPYLLPVVMLLVADALRGHVLSLMACGLAAGLFIKGRYAFDSTEEPVETTVLELMSDPYASPLKGKPVALSGSLVGKADAGNVLGEDFRLQDATGLIYTNFESRFGLLGNLIFGGTKANKLLGKDAEAVGWFRRDVTPRFDLRTMTVGGGERIRSWTREWALIPGTVLAVVGVILLVMGQ